MDGGRIRIRSGIRSSRADRSRRRAEISQWTSGSSLAFRALRLHLDSWTGCGRHIADVEPLYQRHVGMLLVR